MTAEQNNTLADLSRKVAEFNTTLPDGERLEIVIANDLTQLIAAKNKLLSVFRKLSPWLTGFSGGGNIMDVLPNIMPVVQTLQTDTTLNASLAEIMEWVKALEELEKEKTA